MIRVQLPALTRASLSRLTSLLVAVPLALVCVLGLTLSEARAATEFEGCVDTVQLSSFMTLSDPSALASIERNASEAAWLDLIVEAPRDDEDDAAFYVHGMSCDGPSSCAPNLMAAVSAAAADDQGPDDDAPRGGMCSSLDPSDCDLEPVPAPTRAELQLSNPLVPFLRDLEMSVPTRADAHEDDVQRRNPREQSLFSRATVRRLDRPPTTR